MQYRPTRPLYKIIINFMVWSCCNYCSVVSSNCSQAGSTEAQSAVEGGNVKKHVNGPVEHYCMSAIVRASGPMALMPTFVYILHSYFVCSYLIATSHLYKMLYSALHNEYMSTAVLTVCIYSPVMLPCILCACCTRGTQYCSPK